MEKFITHKVSPLKLADVDEQYRKFPALKKVDVEEILQWVKDQQVFPDITELEAILFLHSNYCKMEATKKTIETYFDCRAQYPQYFANRDALGDDIKSNQKVMSLTSLPKLTKEGYKVFLGKLIDTDPKKVQTDIMFKEFSFVTDSSLLKDGCVEGHIIIVDFAGSQMGHSARLGFFQLKRYLFYVQEAVPVRLKGLHFFNVPSYIDKFVYILRPFMKKEVIGMFHLHTTMESAYGMIDREILPKEYGGLGPTMQELCDEKNKRFTEMREYFLHEETRHRIKPLDTKKPNGGFWKILGF